MTRFVRYARVSTQDQEVQLQIDALKKAGSQTTGYLSIKFLAPNQHVQGLITV